MMKCAMAKYTEEKDTHLHANEGTNFSQENENYPTEFTLVSRPRELYRSRHRQGCSQRLPQRES